MQYVQFTVIHLISNVFMLTSTIDEVCHLAYKNILDFVKTTAW